MDRFISTIYKYLVLISGFCWTLIYMQIYFKENMDNIINKIMYKIDHMYVHSF
jgi:hypothetical protein